MNSFIEVNGVAVSASIAVGFVLPFIVSFIKRNNWTDRVKHFLSFAASVVAAAVIAYFDQGVNTWQTILASTGIIFTVANTFYSQYFGYTAINAKLESLTIGHQVVEVPVPENAPVIGFASAKPAEAPVEAPVAPAETPKA